MLGGLLKCWGGLVGCREGCSHLQSSCFPGSPWEFGGQQLPSTLHGCCTPLPAPPQPSPQNSCAHSPIHDGGSG